MKVAIPAETRTRERRVAPVPEMPLKPTAAGFEVTLQAGAGRHVLRPDDVHRATGAQVHDGEVLGDADVVLSVQPHTRASIALTEHDSPTQTVRKP